MNSSPLVSIIIPTRNSSCHLPTLLKSIADQNFTRVESLIVDNKSEDKTLQIAKKYKLKIISCEGIPPQVAKQRNMGASESKGDYLFFMDHDMELSDNFLNDFSKEILKNDTDAWYIHEKIISNSKILSIVRNFEAGFIDGTVISAARMIKREVFFPVGGFDESLSGGPSDWDLNNRLKLKNAKFAIFKRIIYHHEENLSFKNYIFKKTSYIKGGEKYKRKWKEADNNVYRTIVNRQYGTYYRLIGVFIENAKWKKLLKNLNKYIIFLAIKLFLALNYQMNLYYKKYVK